MSMFQKAPKKVPKVKSEKKDDGESSSKKSHKDKEADKIATAAAEREIRKEEEKKRKAEEKKAREKAEKEAKEKAEKERRAREKAAKQAALDAQFGESLDSELTALETSPTCSLAKAHGEAYNLFPQGVYAAYGKLQEYARDLNTSIAAPEIVFIGRQGDGKTALIDAVVGERINPAGDTKRPLHLTLVNNAECTTPRITVKRDSTIPEYDHDTPATLQSIASEIDDRNRDFTDVPIYVLYESASVMNVTLIDTPGIDDKNPKAEALVQTYLQDADRQIVAVESAKDFSECKLLELVKKADPELSRSIFVFSKFNLYLRTFAESRELNRYLSQAYPDVPTYFVSLPSSRVSVEDGLSTRVLQALNRDMALLEQLQHDKRHEASFGAYNVRRRLFRGVWRGYQDSVPRVLKQLRARSAATDAKLRAVQAQLQELNSSKLRSIASQYVVTFLQSIQRLIEGTADANPAATGQTLLEERREHGADEWLDGQNRPIRFDPNEWKVPYADAKLYGGQQFERALAEFRAVVEHSDLGAVSFDDIASSTGLNRLNNVQNFGWAASDLVANKTREAFVPLIEQLTARVVYLVKRLATLSDTLIDQQRAAAKSNATGVTFGASTAASAASSGVTGGDDDAFAPEHFPYFTHHVKDLFYKFVDNAAANTKEKCLDEFYSTRTIYWHLSEYGDRKFPTERGAADEAQKAVVDLATDVFAEMRNRIIGNVMLKFYNFFLVPLQSVLWTDIQGRITTLSDKSLEQLFHLGEMRSRLTSQEKRFTSELQRLSSQDERFRAAASAFAHPVSQANVRAAPKPAADDDEDED